jgi:DNA-binding NarL/FixJ family response regulator
MKPSGTSNALQTPLRVLLVDPWTSILEMLEMMFARQRRWKISAKTTSGTEGLRLFQELAPDLVIMDLMLPGMDGTKLIEAIRRGKPETRIVLYTATGNRELLQAGFDARPQGFIHKAESLAELRKAVSVVAEGGQYFSPEMQRLRQETAVSILAQNVLTSRQKEVLKLIAESVNTKQIAAYLSISPKTVENYRGQFALKLGLRDVAALTRYALQTGLIGVGETCSSDEIP